MHLFQALSLAYQHVSFKVYNDERLIYTVPAAQSLSDRIAQVFESSLSKKCLLIHKIHERMNLKITGAIGDSSHVRYDRNHIFVFVNNRWVKNHKLTQSFIKGYQGMLPTQRYPAGFIFITVDPACVDINIHPRKEEVQFLHPRIVEDLLQDCVRERLEERHAQQLGKTEQTFVKPAAQLLPKESLHAMQSDLTVHSPMPSNKERETFLDILEQSFSSAQDAQAQATLTTKIVQNSFNDSSSKIQGGQQTPLPLSQPGSQDDAQGVGRTSSIALETLNYRLVGQLQATYIIIETAEGLVLIDQHAAHERIIYERIRSRFEDVARLNLLFPQIITLTRDDCSPFEPLEILGHFGIEAELLSDQEIVIKETPVFLKNQSLEDLIKQSISALHEYQYLDADELKKIIHEKVHAQVSCKAAVKAGDELSNASMHEIIKDLYVSDNKLTCPHGRPYHLVAHYRRDTKNV